VPRLLAPLVVLLCTACAYRTSVWVAPWEPASGANAISNQSSITRINPVWYALSADGAVTKVWNAEDPKILAAFDHRRIVPTIQNYVKDEFDAAVVEHLLRDPNARARHVDDIMNIVEKNGYGGIDIDYERLPGSLRDEYSAFLALLSARLRAQHRKLSVTVDAKTKSDETRAGPAGEDWHAIGRVADAVNIMAYDYHYGGGAPGPLAPIKWLMSVADYAANEIPARKQFWGLPWYGYDWNGPGAGSAVGYAKALEVANANHAATLRDANGELSYRYDTHEVWFVDQASYRMKVNALLKSHPWIGGFAHWRAGTEDPAVWIDVNDLNRRRVR